MKKLMIALAVAAIAGFAQAATCSWGSGALKTAASADGGWSGTNVNTANALVTMSIYLIDSDTYDSLATASQKDLFDSYSTKEADLTGQNKNANTGALIGAITINEADSYAGVQYAVAIATYTDANYGDMYIATRATAGFNAATQKGSATGIFANVASATGGGWQSVPEPTSGLLMLLGMAGLALRRRRA